MKSNEVSGRTIEEAISSGLEWNVKVTAKDLPSTIQKMLR